MKEDWFKTKFINPRTKEGKPQTERLEYAREFFESFGTRNEKFSCAVMVGSTMRGSGYEEFSDIDVIIFYYEEPKQEQEQNFSSILDPDHWKQIHTFNNDFQNFEYDFRYKKEKESKKYFKIDIRPGIYNLAKIELSPKNILEYAELFYELSYPIIKTKNPHALMSIEKTLNRLRELVEKLSKEQKEKLLKLILHFAEPFEKPKRSFQEVNSSVEEEEYVKSRLRMLKNQLQIKFGLD